MAHKLKNDVAELRNAFSSLLAVLENAEQDKQISTISEVVQTKIADIDRQADELDVAISARDANIRALGEKLSTLRMQNAKPFRVDLPLKRSKGDPTQRQRRKSSLFRPSESRRWSREETKDHMKEMAEEIARLSLLPMGLPEKEMQKYVADISAARLYESKAVNLITVARNKNLSDIRIRAFLKKKGLPDVTIDRCFGLVTSKTEELQEPKQMPRLPMLSAPIRDDEEESEMVEYEFTRTSIILSSVPESNSAA